MSPAFFETDVPVDEMNALVRYRARIAAAGLVLLAVWEITIVVGARQTAPTSEDWQGAAVAVRHASGPNALILFAPRWIDPIGRLWLGDRISVNQAARMDAVRYGDVWEISIRGATAPEVAHETPVSDLRFGRVRARHFLRNAPTVTWDIAAQSQLNEVDFEPRRGVLLELGQVDQERRLVFADVPLGTELQVYGGLADYRTRYENRATARLQVMVDGREVSSGDIGNESGWLALPAVSTSPGPHRVELVARVHDSRGPIRLALCVAAEARTLLPR
jgi:hypothetical protein